MLLSEDTNSAPRKKQRTLFAGPGATQVNLVDKRNRVHYLPVDKETVQALTQDNNVGTVTNEYPRCGRTFSNEQGLGGHLLHYDQYDLLLPSSYATNERNIVPYTVVSPSPSCSMPHSFPKGIATEKNVIQDQRCHNHGKSKRRRYTMKEKYEIIEMCDEAIASDLNPQITNPTQYFNYYYRSFDVAHKWIAQYGK